MVYNKRTPGYPKDAVYVGRPSKWGNPYAIGKDGTRAEVIEKYRNHLASTYLCHEVSELRGKNLLCWCAPQPCHADVLLQMANIEYDLRNVR